MRVIVGFPAGGAADTTARIIGQYLSERFGQPFLADPKIQSRFADLGAAVMPGSPDDFGKLIADETERWTKVVKFAGISAAPN